MVKKVFVKSNSLLAKWAAQKLKSQNCALVLRRTIHLHGITYEEFVKNEQWLCHELFHVYQYQREGTIPFLLKYLFFTFRYGYTHNPLEVEARAQEQNKNLLKEYELKTIS